MIIPTSSGGNFITADHTGAMTALLRNALRPNLPETSENTPAIIHAGPCANISHGKVP